MALILQTRLPSVQLEILKCALPSADFGAPKCARPFTELGVYRFARSSTELVFPKCPRPYVARGTHYCALSGLAFRIRSRQRRDSIGAWKHVGSSSPVRLAARGAVRASAMKVERTVVELEGKRLSKLHSEINKASWLRIAEGLHTRAQVIVGSVLGSTGAKCWLWIWKTGVEASVDTFPFLRIILVILFGIGCFLTYVTNCKHWEFGKH